MKIPRIQHPKDNSLQWANARTEHIFSELLQFIIDSMQHAIRRVYDQNGHLSYSDAGYWFRKLDRNTERTIFSLTAPETPIPQEEMPLSTHLPFGGIPTHICWYTR